jgi:glycerol-3-phosphate cytidylyltransferase
VDEVVAQVDMEKMLAWRSLKFDKMFVGDDWRGTPEWKIMEEQFNAVGVEVVYFPYTRNTSSTLLRHVLEELHSRI